MFTKNYYYFEIITWNHIILYESVLDRNNWNYTTACKLFVFDKNAWYITVLKVLNNDRKNVNINVEWMWFPNL